MRITWRSSTRWARIGAITAVLAFACAGAALAREGPGIEKRPAGFLYDPNQSSVHLVFPGRQKIRQFGYFTPSDARVSIVITSYLGPPLTRSEAVDAREAMSREFDQQTYGEIE